MLADFNLAHQISHYSYSYGDYVYLEEDVDLAKFFNAYRAKHGHDPKIQESRCANSSRVRTYAAYRPQVIA
jgi:hypothetical protein